MWMLHGLAWPCQQSNTFTSYLDCHCCIMSDVQSSQNLQAYTSYEASDRGLQQHRHGHSMAQHGMAQHSSRVEDVSGNNTQACHACREELWGFALTAGKASAPCMQERARGFVLTAGKASAPCMQRRAVWVCACSRQSKCRRVTDR